MQTVQSLAQHADLIRALCRNLSDGGSHARVVETHISSVVLCGASAYKIKKPVKLAFVDFSNLASRRHYCDEEIRLNRRSAPDLYLDVVPIVGSLEQPRLGHEAHSDALEYAVRMRRFDEQDRLDRVARAGRLTEQHIDRMAQAVAAFHERCELAPSSSAYGSIDEIALWAQQNLVELNDSGVPAAALPLVATLQRWTTQQLARCAVTFEERRRRGKIRECHGDLHLGNLVLLGDTPVAFDCIDFNDRLRFIDVINDVAFTFMDLIEHDQPAFGWRFINAYLACTGDLHGLALLRFYSVYRALVRAKIAQIRLLQGAREESGDSAPLRYLRTAADLAEPAPRHLVLTCGLAGSGKSTVAQAMLEQLGAVRVRSDVERKRLADLGVARDAQRAETADAAPGIEAGLYAPARSEQTYAHLLDAARTIVQADFTAIVDAAFLKRRARQRFIDLARELGVPLTIVLCRAPLPVLQARIEKRLQAGADPSDATLAVLEHQMRVYEAPDASEHPAVVEMDTDVDRQQLQNRAAALAAQWSITGKSVQP